eukprot:gene2340-4551_t
MIIVRKLLQSNLISKCRIISSGYFRRPMSTVLKEQNYLRQFIKNKVDVIGKYVVAMKYIDKILDKSEPFQNGDRFGEYEYFQQRCGGDNHAKIYRRRCVDGSMVLQESPLQMVLDLNDISLWWSLHFCLLQIRPSVNQKYLAFTIECSKENGLETILFIKDIIKNTLYRIVLPIGCSCDHIMDLDWACCPSTPILYLTVAEDRLRASRVLRIVLREYASASSQWNDSPKGSFMKLTTNDITTILTEPNPRYFLSLNRSKDSKWIIVHSHSKTCTEALVVDAHNPTATAEVFKSRRTGVRYFLDHGGDGFLVASTDGSSNGELRLYRQSSWRRNSRNVDSESDWTLIWPKQGVDGRLEDWDLFASGVVVYGRCDRGIPAVWLIPLSPTSRSTKDSIDQSPTVSDQLSTMLSSVVGSECFRESMRAFQITPASNGSYAASEAQFSVASLILPGGG